jgi:hypothetical protein
MSISNFAKDLERFGFKTTIDGKTIEVDYEDLQLYIEIEKEWETAINKIYKAKQYEVNVEAKFLTSNKSIEFQVFKLTPSYISKPYYEFTDDSSDKIFLSNMSKEYQLLIFRSEEYNIERVIRRIKLRFGDRPDISIRRTRRSRFRIEDLFINFNTITFRTKKTLEKKILVEKGRNKCKSCLFKLAVNQNESWELRETIKAKGFNIPITEDGNKDMSIPKSNYDDDLVGFYKVAKSSLFSTQAFLSFYHVLEYNFLRVADEELFNKTKSIINSTTFSSSYENVNKLLSVLQKHEKNLDETSMLKRVLTKYIIEEDLISFIKELERTIGENAYSKPKENIFGERLPIKLEVGHAISNTATIIKHLRNSLVHSSDKYTREECVIPFSESESVVIKYIPIIRFLSENVIYANAK